MTPKRASDNLRQISAILIARSLEHCVLTRRLVAASAAALEASKALLERARPWSEVIHEQDRERQQ